MECNNDQQCPQLYHCEASSCIQDTFLNLHSDRVIVTLLLLPILCTLNNRLGIASTWLMYLFFVDVLGYHFMTSLHLVGPVVLGSAIVAMLFAVFRKHANTEEPAINYYITNALVPVMIVGVNMGMLIQQSSPLFVSLSLGFLLALLLIGLLMYECKETHSQEKIQTGKIKEILPPQVKHRPKRPHHRINMSLIEEEDEEYESHDRSMSPSRKKQLRQSILTNHQQHNHLKSAIFIICNLIVLQSIILALPPLFTYLSISCVPNLILTAFTVLALLVLCQYYVYKHYIEPKEDEEVFFRGSLGLHLNSQKTIKVCVVGALGGLCQGWVGLGGCELIMCYLLISKVPHQSVFAIGAFQTLFIAIILTIQTFSTIPWQMYLTLFLITLIFSSIINVLLQLLLSSCFSPDYFHTSMMVMMVIVELVTMLSVICGMGLGLDRWGWQYMTTYTDIC